MDADRPIIRTFDAEGYITGDFECFCIGTKSPRPAEQNYDDSIYPNTWFGHLSPNKKWRLKITVEATEVDADGR